MFAAAIISASALAVGPGLAAPLTVAEVVKSLSVDESKFSYEDEPPGKLRVLECPGTMGHTKITVRIELIYTTELFSDQRTWDIKKVRSAKVHRVVIEPLVTDK